MDPKDVLSIASDIWTAFGAVKNVLRTTARKVGPTRNPSREEFEFIRQRQKTNRRRFAEMAYQLPRHSGARGFFHYAPLICQDTWIPRQPILLPAPTGGLEDDSSQLVTTFAKKVTPASENHVRDSAEFRIRAEELLPLRSGGAGPFHSLSDAILQIEKPPDDLFVSRPSYSLEKISSGPKHRLSFSEAKYFDYIDCGELLAFEMIFELLRIERIRDREQSSMLLAHLDERVLLRTHGGEWNAISFRPSLAGVNSLTVFLDRERRIGSFPMMSRSSKVGSAMGTLHVIPAGEFQPTNDSPIAFRTHCTLWQTILREFAEELLLDEEAKSSGLDMRELAAREKIRPLIELIRSGDWESYYLGVALDPLTLKPEIMTISLIDQERFLEALGDFLDEYKLPSSNTEGTIKRGPFGWGEDLNFRNLITYRDDSTTLPAGSGCIELLLRRAGDLIPGLR